MLVYFVIGDSPDLKNEVESLYSDYHEEFVGGWVVAVRDKTPSDVSESLGMNAENKTMGIVVKADSYNGYYSNSLWEKISLWKGVK